MNLSYRPLQKDDLHTLLVNRNKVRNRYENNSIISEANQYNWYESAWKDHNKHYSVATDDKDNVVGLSRITAMGIWHPGEAHVGFDVVDSTLEYDYGCLILEETLNRASNLKFNKLHTWLFIKNEKQFNVYKDLGFYIDELTPVKFYVRNNQPLMYIRMINY